MGSDTVKLITLPDGNKVLTSSGTVTPNAKAVLVTDTQGNPVIHQSGAPKSGTTALMGTDRNGNKIVLFAGDSLSDPIVWTFWPDPTGKVIYVLKPIPLYWEPPFNYSPGFELNLKWYLEIPIEVPIQSTITNNIELMGWNENVGARPFRHFGCLYLGLSYIYTDAFRIIIFRQMSRNTMPVGDTPGVIEYNPNLIHFESIRDSNTGAFKSDGKSIWAATVVGERSAVAYLYNEFVEELDDANYYNLIGPLSIPVDNHSQFPNSGLIQVTYTDTGGNNHTRLGIYYGKDGDALSQIYVDASANRKYLGVYYFFMENLLPITFSYEFESGPFRVTDVRWRGNSGFETYGGLYVWHEFELMAIKVDGSVPDEGYFVLVDKDSSKHYNLTIYQYTIVDGWLTGTNGICFFYTAESNSYYFCGILLSGSDWTTQEMEIPAENARQGYIYELKSNDAYHGIRFFHSFEFHGVQTFLKPYYDKNTGASTKSPNIIRVLSTTGKTYILYEDYVSPRSSLRRRYLKELTLPSGFYSTNEVKCGRYPNVGNQTITPPGGYRYLEIATLGNTVFAYCTNETYNEPSAIFYSTGGGGWSLLREIKSIPSPTDITNVIRTYSGYSCSFTALEGDYAFLLIPEQQFIKQGAYPYHRYVNSYYSLYRISRTFEVYKYSFSAPGYPSDPIGNLENDLLIRTPIPRPALQMICYDTMDPQFPFEDSLFPGSTYVAIRYYTPDDDSYNPGYNIGSIGNTSRLRRFEIPHELMSVVP